jgi:uncharacterized sulfatase
VGFLPEAEVNSRAEGSTPYELGRDERRYPMKRVMQAAEAASLKRDAGLKQRMADPDSGVRYWAALGMLMRGSESVKANAETLRKALGDTCPSVRIAAAEALGRYGDDDDSARAIAVLLALAPAEANGVCLAIAALNAINAMGARARSARDALKGISVKDPKADPRMSEYAPRLVEDTLVDLQ